MDAAQLARVPAHGPLIVISNHINFLDVPVIYTRLEPRAVTCFAKIEIWDSAFLGWLFNVWGAIPINRGEADMSAIRRGLAALEDGQILAIAPEGTRSNHGRLQRGHPGVVMMALLSGAPILPLVHYGGEQYRQNLPHLHRTDCHVIVGQLFELDKRGEKVTRTVRQKMTDEIMYQMAALLPPAYRGEYSDMSKATESYLHFLPSNPDWSEPKVFSEHHALWARWGTKLRQ
jgi:1-acyl-sn-glycerol-3-phosphate acyltransferase